MSSKAGAFHSKLNFKLFFLFTLALILFAIYLPGISTQLFPIDDNVLIEALQILAPFQWKFIQTIFTVGTHVDYYPIRDLSYFFDFWLFGKNWWMWHVHQIFIFLEITTLLFFILDFLKVRREVS